MTSEYNHKQKRLNMGFALEMMKVKFNGRTKSGKPITTRYSPEYIKRVCKLSYKEAQDIGLFPKPVTPQDFLPPAVAASLSAEVIQTLQA